MAQAAARVGESLSALGDELPTVGGRMEGQLENPECIGVAYQAIRHDLHDGGVIRSAGAYDEFPDASGGISNSIGILRAEALVDVIVAIKDDIRIVVI